MDEMRMQTEGGEMEVSVTGDYDYPGFIFRINGEEVALFEYDATSARFNIHVWAQHDKGLYEDPVSYRYTTDLGGDDQ